MSYRDNRYYQKQYSNYQGQGRYNNNYGYNNNYNNDYYDYRRSNTNYNNNYKNDYNDYGKNKGYNNSNNYGYNRAKTQYKEIEIKDKNKKEKYDKTEIPEYVKKINETIDDSSLKEFCEKDKKTIKLSDVECPINKNLMLYDISIAIKGPEEELAYLEHPDYISIIRRGNTLLEIYKSIRRDDYVLQRSILIRKGMKKFIDLPYNFYRDKTEVEKK